MNGFDLWALMIFCVALLWRLGRLERRIGELREALSGPDPEDYPRGVPPLSPAEESRLIDQMIDAHVLPSEWSRIWWRERMFIRAENERRAREAARMEARDRPPEKK